MTTAEPHQIRDDITGLRALAVIAVIIFHMDTSLLPGGFLGVDVFFVISGYVITMSLMKSGPLPLGAFLLRFYQKRIRRLMPALILLVVVCSAVISMVDPAPRMSLLTGMAGLFGLSNMLLLFSATDYFAADTEFNIFTHTWSLGVEEQYYLLYPVLFWLLTRGASADTARRRVFAAMALLSCVTLVLFQWLSQTNPSAAFFLMPTRLWELGAGCMLCLATDQQSTAPWRRRSGPVLAPLAVVLLVACFLIPEHAAFWTTPLSVLATVALLAMASTSRPVFALLSNPVAVWIGLASYSLYLWHWPVLVLGRWTTGITLATAPLQLAAIFALGAVSYHLVETPLRKTSWSKWNAGTVLIGLGAASLAACCVAVLYLPLKGDLYLGEPKVAGQTTASALFPEDGEFAITTRRFADACNLTPNLLSGAKKGPKPEITEAFLAGCLHSDSTRQKLVLLGDSFASRSVEHLALAADALGLQFGVLFGYNCPFPLRPSDIAGMPAESCREHDYDRIIDAVVAAVRPGDILVLRLYLAKDQYVSYAGGNMPVLDSYDAALTNFSQRVRDHGGRVVLLGGNPTLPIQAAQSMNPQWFNKALYSEFLTVDSNVETRFDHALDAHLQALFDGSSLLSYIPVNHWFCDDALTCRTRTASEVYYLDKVHLSPAAYDLFYDDLLAHLRAMSGPS
ncbi:acyltransferase family protein [Frigidibacter mobilis]|uniref:Acyltransferase n=1 Tax=Frigidibacter mobilis TaxID=1335048 RepID=A0A165SSF5_9RHOB|nr:acyltransferase family protein [Frigidibacter mobilis]AMY70569.1 acyltransferase [Frigidibacter mobilis]